MRLSWGEIKARARAFAKEWKDAHFEKGETQSFYNDFFAIFGIKRRQVAVYEQRVKLLNDRHGFIDLFWPGTLLIEHKSAGRDLKKAQSQAFDYFDALREDQQPRFILTCDFQNFKLLDLDTGENSDFTLAELHKNIEVFAFVLGRQTAFSTAQEDVSVKAAELMGGLHDALEASGYIGHDLERLLVRLLFCLFGDDTGIFEPKDIFLNLIEIDTKEDGTDVGRMLIELFDMLDTPDDQRQSNARAELTQFPYINGGLFAGHVRTPVFDRLMRETLLKAARFNWTKVSPAIFGSLFQSVMNKEERRAKGAHYTTETNILKVIRPLFLNKLWEEFGRIKARRTNRSVLLTAFQAKLGSLRFLDPACGCGNFLIIAYRELRRLELEVIQTLRDRSGVIDGHAVQQTELDTAALSVVTVEQFYGIEFEEFPSRIAEVAMWMTDHLANNELSLAFGQSYARIPLTESPHIRHADALEIDWNDLLPGAQCSYVMGNPPFLGSKNQTDFQRSQVRRIAGLGGSGGTLDYVAAWFIKAGEYVAKGPTGIAFVSTNSITQGEQVAQLWPILFAKSGLEISFAHRPFVWASEARGKAQVHVVIVGLNHRDHEPEEKLLFSYPNMKGDPVETSHAALTAYLFDARTVANRHLVVSETPRPLNGARKLIIGSKPIDGGYLIFSPDERSELLASEPAADKYLRPFVGSKEFINDKKRWIAGLQSADPHDLAASSILRNRLALVRRYRNGEVRPKDGDPDKPIKAPGISSRRLADTPAQFHVTVIPTDPFLVVPEVSSETREYVPIGWLNPPSIPSNKLRILPNATVSEFALLASKMHMAWLSHIGGKLKSDYQYGIGVVYNTFPVPDITTPQMDKLVRLSEAVLEARKKFPAASLAELYDPNLMPIELRNAHTKLDLAVDRLYRAEPFASDRDRVEHLFGRYEKMVDPMGSTAAKINTRVARRVNAGSAKP
jgi:hypothetical protein